MPEPGKKHVVAAREKESETQLAPAPITYTAYSVVSVSPLQTSNLTQPQESVTAILQSQSKPLYAVLDGARDERILPLLRNSGEQYQSLYEGEQAMSLNDCAPYLVALPKNSPLLSWLLKEVWGKSWGIYGTSASSFLELRRHFRNFLLVQTAGGRQVYFRFYDPRVLSVFLPACTEPELRQFFGPVSSYWIEGSQANSLTQFVSPDADREGIGLPYRIKIWPWRMRQEQLQAFKTAHIQRFEQQMVEQLRSSFPRLAAKLGVPGLREVIRHGINRSRNYGIVSQRDVGRYIALMFMFGPDFDLKASGNSLRAILQDSRFTTSTARVDALCKEALRVLGNRTRTRRRKPNW